MMRFHLHSHLQSINVLNFDSLISCCFSFVRFYSFTICRRSACERVYVCVCVYFFNFKLISHLVYQAYNTHNIRNGELCRPNKMKRNKCDSSSTHLLISLSFKFVFAFAFQIRKKQKTTSTCVVGVVASFSVLGRDCSRNHFPILPSKYY